MELKLRPYREGEDYPLIEAWIGDERTHALWCAGRFLWPLRRENFEATLRELAEKKGDRPLLAETEAGEGLGFFVWSPGPAAEEGTLKFVVVAPEKRGRGYGRRLMALAADYAAETAGAKRVRLSVFTANEAARRCYEAAGFTAERTEEGAFAFREERWGRCQMLRSAKCDFPPFQEKKNSVNYNLMGNTQKDLRLGMNGKYQRILLKMSGEALAGESGRGIDFDFTARVCRAVKQCVDAGVQVSVVVGGGNYWRGGKDGGDRMVRARADYMGMLATAMNSIALVDALEKEGAEAVIQSSFGLERVAEPFNRDAAVRHLKAGRVVIFACGSGEPFFTTDTAAVLRALDIEADVLLLGKNVDGIYSADPRLDPQAVKFDHIEYAEVLRRDLKAMDAAATQLAMENKLPLCVFGLKDPENIARAAAGEAVGTVVT